MAGLPEQQVGAVLKSRWANWLDWRTTGTQLAATLGIKVPAVPQPPLIKPVPGARINQPNGPAPQNPVCKT